MLWIWWIVLDMLVLNVLHTPELGHLECFGNVGTICLLHKTGNGFLKLNNYKLLPNNVQNSGNNVLEKYNAYKETNNVNNSICNAFFRDFCEVTYHCI